MVFILWIIIYMDLPSDLSNIISDINYNFIAFLPIEIKVVVSLFAVAMAMLFLRGLG